MRQRVFFSFDHENDLWKAHRIRNSLTGGAAAAAGFVEASLWHKARIAGNEAVKRLIDARLENTSVTALLISAQIATRKYLEYEIEQSIAHGNGLLGIYIWKLQDQFGHTDLFRGELPERLKELAIPCYDWDPACFAQWVEAAAGRAAG